MHVLQHQFGEGFECIHCKGEEAVNTQRHLDELLGVYADNPNGPVDKLILFFEYMGAHGYGFGLYYEPEACNQREVDEDECECLLFLSDDDRLARQKAEEYLADLVSDYELQPMPFVSLVRAAGEDDASS